MDEFERLVLSNIGPLIAKLIQGFESWILLLDRQKKS